MKGWSAPRGSPVKQKPASVAGSQNPPTAIETAAGVISLSAVTGDSIPTTNSYHKVGCKASVRDFNARDFNLSGRRIFIQDGNVGGVESPRLVAAVTCRYHIIGEAKVGTYHVFVVIYPRAHPAMIYAESHHLGKGSVAVVK